MTARRSISDDQVREVIASIKANKGTVLGEARRLGVYHATIRNRMRSVLGEEAYASLMRPKNKRRIPQQFALRTEEVAAIVHRLRVGESAMADEARRLGLAYESFQRTLRLKLGKERYSELRAGLARWQRKRPVRVPKEAQSSPPPPASTARSQGCFHGRLLAGTDGAGHAVLFCKDCPYTEVIERRLATG